MRFTVSVLALCSFVHVAHVSAACPRCTDTNPVMTGSFSGHTFQPTQDCYLGVPEVADIFALLAGSWLYAAGGSNGWATFNPLLRQLAPGYLNWDDERFSRGTIQPTFIDLASYALALGVACCAFPASPAPHRAICRARYSPGTWAAGWRAQPVC